jgi:DNA-binding response OmpR family regulator
VSVPTILIADDEPLVAKLYARAISSLGFAPLVVGDGQAALDVILKTPPALLITDINMPGLDGLQLLTWLTVRKLKHFPVLMLSGDDDVAVLRAGLAAGADDFIIKGMAFSVIQERVKFWLSTGMQGLTDEGRALALTALEHMPDMRRPAARLNALPARLLARVEIVMTELLAETPADFGRNHTQQVRFLGVLNRVVGLVIAQDGLAQLRRFDLLAGAVAALHTRRPALTAANVFSTLKTLPQGANRATYDHAAETLDLLG